MKRIQAAAALLFLSLLTPGCAGGSGAAVQNTAAASDSIVFTDDTGRSVSVKSCDRVVSLYGSYAEAWTLAGGTLAGTTEDAVRERNLSLGDDVKVVGTVKSPNLEQVLSLSPDFVILSSEIPSQVSLDASLSEADIPHAYFSGNRFDGYLSMMNLFCRLTGRQDLYQKNVAEVKGQIDKVLQNVSALNRSGPSVLLMRAYSGGCEAKGSNSVTGEILQDLGAQNLAERDSAVAEGLSMEQIIADDPEYILVVVMGKEDDAKEYLRQKFESDPAWSQLTAVREGHYVILPKELFQYKPNARWGESYEYLARLLYPGIAED